MAPGVPKPGPAAPSPPAEQGKESQGRNGPPAAPRASLLGSTGAILEEPAILEQPSPDRSGLEEAESDIYFLGHVLTDSQLKLGSLSLPFHYQRSSAVAVPRAAREALPSPWVSRGSQGSQEGIQAGFWQAGTQGTASGMVSAAGPLLSVRGWIESQSPELPDVSSVAVGSIKLN